MVRILERVAIYGNRSRSRIETLIPAVRALIARELINRWRLSKAEVARILGVTPAAITQYIKGRRASKQISRIENREEVRKYIEEVSERIAISGKKMSLEDLFNIAYEVSILLQHGNAGQQYRVKDLRTDIKIIKILEKLQSRIQLENDVARLYMNISLKVKSPVLKYLFRQIASDSVRHAEILIHVKNIIENNVATEEIDPISREELESLKEFEEKADEMGFDEVYSLIDDPYIKTLLKTIEYDEEKHTKIINSLINIYSNKYD